VTSELQILCVGELAKPVVRDVDALVETLYQAADFVANTVAPDVDLGMVLAGEWSDDLDLGYHGPAITVEGDCMAIGEDRRVLPRELYNAPLYEGEVHHSLID
jgi:hypothetical protein